MTLQSREKLNKALSAIPETVVVPMAWFHEQGISRQLLHTYVKHDWFIRVGRGAYCKQGLPPSWTGVVLGLQQLLQLPCHVGGETALYYQGFGHYLSPGGIKKVSLWGESFPAWLTKLEMKEQFAAEHKQLFRVEKNREAEASGLGLRWATTGVRSWGMLVSTPERAILEAISQMEPTNEGFLYVGELMEGLRGLYPGLMQRLLEACKHVQVKRICLFLAEYYQLSWVEQLEREKIDLGAGNRQVVKGGHLDKKYQITVPADFVRE